MVDEKQQQRQPEKEMPVPGPHADPKLIDPDKTPGSGMLPEADDPNASPSG